MTTPTTHDAATVAAPQDLVNGERVEANDLPSIDGAIAQLKAIRKDVLRSSTNVVAVEPHHDYHSYACGRVWVIHGARADDAFALMGLHSLPVEEFCDLIKAAAEGKTGNDHHLVRLQLEIVGQHRDRLDARGRYVSWRRRWAAYRERAERWEAEPEEERRHGHWRTRHMTSGQRELIGDTARLLDIQVPGDLDRGGAHDWLDARGANLVFRKVV